MRACSGRNGRTTTAQTGGRRPGAVAPAGKRRRRVFSVGDGEADGSGETALLLAGSEERDGVAADPVDAMDGDGSGETGVGDVRKVIAPV